MIKILNSIKNLAVLKPDPDLYIHPYIAPGDKDSYVAYKGWEKVKRRFAEINYILASLIICSVLTIPILNFHITATITSIIFIIVLLPSLLSTYSVYKHSCARYNFYKSLIKYKQFLEVDISPDLVSPNSKEIEKINIRENSR